MDLILLKKGRWLFELCILDPAIGIIIEAPFIFDIHILWLCINFGYGFLNDKEEKDLDNALDTLRRD